MQNDTTKSKILGTYDKLRNRNVDIFCEFCVYFCKIWTPLSKEHVYEGINVKLWTKFSAISPVTGSGGHALLVPSQLITSYTGLKNWDKPEELFFSADFVFIFV